MTRHPGMLNIQVEGDITASLGDYLKELLIKLWKEEAFFNSKRPWGNSGWQSPVYKAMIDAGAVEGELDRDGYVDWVDSEKADKIIVNLIEKYIWGG